MNRTLLLGTLIFFAVVGIALMGGQTQAVAGHGHHGMYGYQGYYAAPTWGYGGCCYRSYVVRPVVYYHYRPFYGCCYRCRGCYAYPCCCGYTSYYWYDDCCGAVVQGDVIQKGEATQKSGDAGPAPTPAPAPAEMRMQATPPQAPEQPEEPTPDQPPEPGDDSVLPPKPPVGANLPRDRAMLNVLVPAEATVVINDHRTTSTGTARRYVSRGLEPGRTYRFEVRAEVERDGEKITRTKVVQLKATKVADLMFDFDAPQVVNVNR